MKRSLLVVAAALAVAACQEVSTAPGVADLNSVEARQSNPPPPPIEAEAFVSVGLQTSFARADGIQQLAECEGGLTQNFFVIPATYLFNPIQNNGFVHFRNDNDLDSLTASANGMVQKHGERISGRGTLTFLVNGCELVINLASVSQAIMGDCDAPVIIDFVPAAAPPDNPEQGCFQLQFEEVTFDGEDVPGGASIVGFPEDDEEEIPQ